MARVVEQNKGRLPFSIREELNVEGNLWVTNDAGKGWETLKAGEHHYLAINYLGKSFLDPATIMSAIKHDPNRVFPFFDAVGKNGQTIKIGNEFSLEIAISTNPVSVTDVGEYFFTFSTFPEHTLKGSATHGIFKDSKGELWMFQEGIGPSECLCKRLLNYFAANLMWKVMAAHVNDLIQELEGNNGVFRVTDSQITNVQVQKGDEIHITADGSILFGFFAGRGGPNGINGFEMYSYFPKVKHGCLLASINNTGWHVVGSNNSFVADKDGTVILLVNDVDYTNNVGFFNVKITVTKRNSYNK